MTEVAPRASVVLPTRDRVDLLRRALEAYEAQEGGVPFELLVVDDGSRDDTPGLLRSWRSARFTLHVQRRDGTGPARARNAALAAARGDLVVLAGDDMIPDRGFVAGHATVDRSHDGGIVIGRTEWDPSQPLTRVMRHVDGFGAQQFHFAYLRDGQLVDFRFFYGSNLSLPRRCLPEGAAFDERYDQAAFEDADLGYRLLGRRRGIRYARNVVCRHVHPHTLDSFSDRQVRAGRMAAVFFEAHPEAKDLFRHAEVASAVDRVGRGSGPQVSATLEAATAALRSALAAEADATDGPGPRWLDFLLIGWFRWCYERGLVERGFAPSPPEPVLLDLLARQMRWPVRAALRAEVSADTRRGLLEVERRLAEARPTSPWRAALDRASWQLTAWARRAYHALHASVA